MVFLPRREIVRLVRANLGVQTTNDLGSQVEEQHVAAVNSAALRVQTECGWVNTLRRTTVDTGKFADRIEYPADCRPGAIRGMACYNNQRYYAVEPRVIPVQADTDQEVIAGGDRLTAVSDQPRFYQQRDLIFLWPRTDKSYPVRIEYMARCDLPADDSISIVDGELIAYAATEIVAMQMGDPQMVQYYEKRYAQRMMALRGWQSSGTRFAMDTQADLGEDEVAHEDLVPNWNRQATAPQTNSGPSA